MKDRKFRKVLFDPSGAISTKLLCSRYPAVKCDDVVRTGFLHGPFNSNLICDPFCADKITLDEGNAVFEGKVVDFLDRQQLR